MGWSQKRPSPVTDCIQYSDDPVVIVQVNKGDAVASLLAARAAQHLAGVLESSLVTVHQWKRQA